VLCENINVGDLVWVNGVKDDGSDSGCGLVVLKKSINLEGAVMVDIFVLCNGEIFPHTNFLKLGVK